MHQTTFKGPNGEEMAKLVTEASSSVVGHDKRHYFLLNALNSRRECIVK